MSRLSAFFERIRNVWHHCTRLLTKTARVQTPTVLQMEAAECGAASLSIIAAHFGRYVPLERMRVLCGVSRDGSKASNLLRAGRELGLIAKGFRAEPDVLRTIDPPYIVHWEFKHFLVVEGIDGDRVYLNDPAHGPHAVTMDAFDASFTGVVLYFVPGDDFEKGGERPAPWRHLWKSLRGSTQALWYAVLAGLYVVAVGLVAAVFARVFVDDVLVQGQTDWLRPLLLVMGGVALLLAGLHWIQKTVLLRLETRMAIGESSRFFWHVLQLPVEFFAQRYSGEIGSRVSLNDKVASLLSRDLATNLMGATTALFYVVVMAHYDVALTLIGVAVAAVNVVALRSVSRRRKDANRKVLQERGKRVGVGMGGLQTIESIKAMGNETAFFRRWSGHQAEAVNASQDLDFYTRMLGIVPTVLTGIVTVSILGVGGYRIMDGLLSVGMLLAFQGFMTRFLAPSSRLVALGGQLQEVEGDLERLRDVLNHDVDPTVELSLADRDSTEREAMPEGALRVDAMQFGYSRFDDPVVDDICLHLRPGQRVALVGASGCGKSTVARLVAGLYRPWAGTVCIDGRPRETVSQRVLAQTLAYVDQDIFLFEGSVRDNLTLWDPTVPDADVRRAARDAGIHDEVMQRPGGYGAWVEEGGRNFSGGQRQRLEIARALVRNPRILVLDEATSALDPIVEATIVDRLRRRGCTCFVVAHRLSTIRDADEIVVLDQGRIVERGTHDVLLASDGAYAALIRDADPSTPVGASARPPAPPSTASDRPLAPTTADAAPAPTRDVPPSLNRSDA